jgi:hypothetical protein
MIEFLLGGIGILKTRAKLGTHANSPLNEKTDFIGAKWWRWATPALCTHI